MRRSLSVLLVAASLVAVSLPVTAQQVSAPGAAQATSSKRYVVAISFDGLNPDAIRQLGHAKAPNFYRLIDEGASTLNARSAYELTETLPNHTGMLTGRRIGGVRGHHVDFNTDNGSTVAKEAGHYVASVFDVVHDRGRKTVFYSAKDKFDLLDRTWGPRYGAPDKVGVNNGRDKIDRYVRADSAELTRRLVSRLRAGTPRAFNFLHIALPDLAGHTYGFMGSEYLKAVEASDALLGQVLEGIEYTEAMRSSVDVVVTADHGGPKGKKRHYDQWVPANYTIPFFAWGVDVAAGADLYDLNPERTDPGAGRPGYYGGAPPIRNTDLGGVATRLLGMPPVKGSLLPGTTRLNVS